MTRFLLAVSAILAAPAALAQTPQHDMSAMPDMAMPAEHHTANLMSGAFGDYPMARDASGTSWQPDVAGHSGVHLVMTDDWMVMGHALLNGD
jgi:hypothetical protein